MLVAILSMHYVVNYTEFWKDLTHNMSVKSHNFLAAGAYFFIGLVTFIILSLTFM